MIPATIGAMIPKIRSKNEGKLLIVRASVEVSVCDDESGPC